MMRKERDYPCEAIVKRGSMKDSNGRKKINLKGVKVTVLTEAKFWNCCCDVMHKIELPDGYPEPPENCETWMVETEYLDFLD